MARALGEHTAQEAEHKEDLAAIQADKHRKVIAVAVGIEVGAVKAAARSAVAAKQEAAAVNEPVRVVAADAGRKPPLRLSSMTGS